MSAPDLGALTTDEVRQIRWCRASALTALSTMADQGVLADVLGDLPGVDDPDGWARRIEDGLKRAGWWLP